MKILLTGVTGFIGQALLPCLLEGGHEVWGCARSRQKVPQAYCSHAHFHILELDFLQPLPMNLPRDFDVAYYLIHSLGKSLDHFYSDEAKQANSFVTWMSQTTLQQVIYVSGITHEEALSTHLASRKNVGRILLEAPFATTILRAAIIIGAGSASFQIMRDLVQRLPVMIGPSSLGNDCQPIALRNVLYYLQGVMLNRQCYGQVLDMGGPDTLSYREMLHIIAEYLGVKRYILTVPWISARFEARWFYFITSAPYRVAINLANSMSNRCVCRHDVITQLLPQPLISFREAVREALLLS